jgi:hypothetical protein
MVFDVDGEGTVGLLTETELAISTRTPYPDLALFRGKGVGGEWSGESNEESGCFVKFGEVH